MVLAHERVRLDERARWAVAELGDAIRMAGRDGWCSSMLWGAPVDRETIAGHLPVGAVEVLVESGIAVVEGSDVNLATTIAVIGGVLTAIPKVRWGNDVVYVGSDSSHLIEAAVRLAPRGGRAADLGTGTGLLSAILASRYRVVVATDIGPSVALAAAVTMALNRFPSGHVGMVCVADVAGGLRRDAFDLVGANAPWVPTPARSAAPRELFAYGGETGVELPLRFVREGAALLRAGGIAITLALDIELSDGQQPLRQALDDLETDGYLTTIVSTPWNRDRPEFVDVMRARQPSLANVEHVAVIVARPREVGDKRVTLFTAVEALRQRWATRAINTSEPSHAP